jgi:hypothetical protein
MLGELARGFRVGDVVWCRRCYWWQCRHRLTGYVHLLVRMTPVLHGNVACESVKRVIKCAHVLLVCATVCRVNMRAIEVTIHNLISSGMDPKTENNAYLGFIYTSFQERATKVRLLCAALCRALSLTGAAKDPCLSAHWPQTPACSRSLSPSCVDIIHYILFHICRCILSVHYAHVPVSCLATPPVTPCPLCSHFCGCVSVPVPPDLSRQHCPPCPGACARPWPLLSPSCVNMHAEPCL